MQFKITVCINMFAHRTVLFYPKVLAPEIFSFEYDDRIIERERKGESNVLSTIIIMDTPPCCV